MRLAWLITLMSLAQIACNGVFGHKALCPYGQIVMLGARCAVPLLNTRQIFNLYIRP